MNHIGQVSRWPSGLGRMYISCTVMAVVRALCKIVQLIFLIGFFEEKTDSIGWSYYNLLSSPMNTKWKGFINTAPN